MLRLNKDIFNADMVGDWNSNTTNVKVKPEIYGSRGNVYRIQIQPMLRLNFSKLIIYEFTDFIQIQPMLRLNMSDTNIILNLLNAFKYNQC